MPKEIPPIPGLHEVGRLESHQWLYSGWGCRWCKKPLSYQETKTGQFVIYCIVCDLDPDTETE